MAGKKINDMKSLQKLEAQGLEEAGSKLGKTQRELTVQQEGAVELSRKNGHRKARWFDN